MSIKFNNLILTLVVISSILTGVIIYNIFYSPGKIYSYSKYINFNHTSPIVQIDKETQQVTSITKTMTWPDGATYKGMIKNGKRNGYGTFQFPDGSSYEGQYKDDLRNGKGTYRYKDGTTYTGDFRDDEPDGNGTMTWKNGISYTGEFKKGEIDGRGRITTKSGITIDGSFFRGTITGVINLPLKNGSKFTSDVHYDRTKNFGTATMPDGNKFIGKYINGRLFSVRNQLSSKQPKARKRLFRNRRT